MRIGSLRSSTVVLGLTLLLLQVPTISVGQEQPPTSQEQATQEPSEGFGNQGEGIGNDATPAPDSAGEVESEPGSDGSKDGVASDEPSEALATESQALQATELADGTDKLVGALKNVAAPTSDGSTGNLSYKIDIDVPLFRGLEPSLSLNYDSSRKTKLSGTYQGWLGVGWSLGGFDVIERASPGYGLPAFDNSDIYLLNGMELVPCAQSAAGSPSCASGVGGTHTTEIESYRRIAYSGSGVNAQWKVTDRDGTVSTFKTIGAIAELAADGTPGDFIISNKWLLSSVADTHGNSVNYDYGCDELGQSRLTGNCYPARLTYNSAGLSEPAAVVTFYREIRPDVLLMANGRDITATKQRIKTIRVRVGTVLRSAYSLTYDRAPFSDASRLTIVDQYGTNASVDTNGVVTPPTTGFSKKRIAQLVYQDTAIDYSSPSLSGLLPYTQKPGNPSFNSSYVDGQLVSRFDLNFDGKAELIGTVKNMEWQHRPQGEGYWRQVGLSSQFQLYVSPTGNVTKRDDSCQ